MEKHGFVYIWYDKKHKRYYIGCHWGTENDGYICSSNWMRMAYKRRPNDFKRRIISRTHMRDNLFRLEDYYLNMIAPDEMGKKYYNLQKNWRHWSEKEETRLSVGMKISRSRTGKKYGGNCWSEESKQKLRKPKSEQTKQNMRKPKGVKRKLSEEHKQKLRKPKSEQHKQNMKLAWAKKKINNREQDRIQT